MKLGRLPLGYDHKYAYSHIGYNLKATDIQAAIGLSQLDKLPKFKKIRKSNFDYFFENLKKFERFFIKKTRIGYRPKMINYLCER